MKEIRISPQKLSLRHKNYFELKVTEKEQMQIKAPSSPPICQKKDINIQSCPFSKKDKSEWPETTLDPNSLEIAPEELT